MIELEIISSPDNDVHGAYLTFADQIIIGKQSNADLIIDDPSLHSHHISLEINDLNLKLIPSSQSICWLNQKKTVNSKFVKTGDLIKIGDTEIKIINFAFSPGQNSLEENLDEKHQKALQDPLKRKLIETIKDELDQLDQGNFYVSKDAR